MACKIRERAIEGSWARWNGLPTLLIGADRGRVTCLERRGSATERGVGWERDGVVDLTDDPALDERNVLASWNGNRFTFVVQPGVDVMAFYTLASSVTTIGVMGSYD